MLTAQPIFVFGTGAGMVVEEEVEVVAVDESEEEALAEIGSGTTTFPPLLDFPFVGFVGLFSSLLGVFFFCVNLPFRPFFVDCFYMTSISLSDS